MKNTFNIDRVSAAAGLVSTKQNFDSIIEFIDNLPPAPAETTPMFVVGLGDLAEDSPRPSLSTAAALQNAPNKRENYFTVPIVVE